MEPSTSKSCTKQGPGVLYIFNHKYFDFDELPVRDGTEYDVQALQESFTIFDVETIIYNDLKFEELYGKIGEISTINFSNHSCIIIAILTHGFKNNFLAARDETYHFNDIILKISTNMYLKSKPKIFLLQACRGDIDSRITKRVQRFKTDGPALSTDELPYYYCDEKYILHSASDEFVSYRDDDVGSPFIQIFCLYLNKLGFHRPISEIFPLIMIEVQKSTRSTQMPEITTNATKPYVFGDYCQGAVSSLSTISEGKTDGSTSKETTDTSFSDLGPDNLDLSIIQKLYGDHCQEAVSEALSISEGKNAGPSMKEIIDESEESSDDSTPFQSSTPKVRKVHSSKFTADTREKNKKGSLFRTIRLFKKKVDKDLENIRIEEDKWVKFCKQHIPRNTVLAGIDLDKEIMHVGRAYFENELLPGKVFLNRSLIAIPYKGRELGLERFEVLTGECYSWVKADPPGTVPLNAVNGGWAECGETLYIGRAQHDGSLTPGKIKLSENCLYIPFGGKEVTLLNYEVLVRSS